VFTISDYFPFLITNFPLCLRWRSSYGPIIWRLHSWVGSFRLYLYMFILVLICECAIVLSGSESTGFLLMFIYAMPFEIKLCRGLSYDSTERFNPFHVVVPVPNQDPYYHRHMLWCFSCSMFWDEMYLFDCWCICSIVDISRIAYHHPLNFLFIINNYQ
jgi:hypothetical protein